VTLTTAYGINDYGQIAVNGFDSETGQSVSYLLTPSANPVPLPGAAWLMLSGLGGLGALARKNQASGSMVIGCRAE
jgi:hypothetical protein